MKGNKTKGNKVKGKKINKKVEQKRKRNPLLYNLLGAVLVSLFVYYGLYKVEKNYWVIKMLEKNYKIIKANSDKTLDDRYNLKLKNSYNYFKYVRNNTPEDAVVYIPGREAFFPKDQKKGVFVGTPEKKMWAIRFLYPRKVVCESEMDKTEYAKKITYVAIVNGVGQEILPYKIKPDVKFGIAPMNKDILNKK